MQASIKQHAVITPAGPTLNADFNEPMVNAALPDHCRIAARSAGFGVTSAVVVSRHHGHVLWFASHASIAARSNVSPHRSATGSRITSSVMLHRCAAGRCADRAAGRPAWPAAGAGAAGPAARRGTAGRAGSTWSHSGWRGRQMLTALQQVEAHLGSRGECSSRVCARRVERGVC